MHQATASQLPQITKTAGLTDVYVVWCGLELAALPAKAFEMTSLFDGHRNVEEVCQACQISEEKGLAIVKKLASMGILRTVPHTGGTRTSLSGFTPEEEAFFSADLDPVDECDEPFPPTISERISLFVSELIFRLKGSPVF